jgi:Domain of unknown function (DUF1839)
MTRVRAIPGLDPTHYARNGLHADHRIWGEKNCYVDIWIELLHALGLEPRAMLSFVLALDFEGDQWTFFKPPHPELWDLYGIDVQELNVWRGLLEHTQEHLAAGKLVSTEADAFWLPDTAGTDYRNTHTKTTILIEDLDLDTGTLGYFHNTGYHRLSGEDFRQTFRLDTAPDPAFMPLFAELVRIDRVERRTTAELAGQAVALLRRHSQRRPASNPIARFETRFVEELPRLQTLGIAHYHAWAFATIRQLGAAFELASLQLDWLAESGHPGYGDSAPAFRRIADSAKVMILKVARSVMTGKPLDATALFADPKSAWDEGMSLLDRTLAASR